MSTPKQTEREKALEAERDDYKAKHEQAEAERDDYKNRYEDARTAHNDARVAFEQADEARKQAEAQRDQLLAETGKSEPTAEQESEATAPADTDPHAETRELLQRMKLPRAFVMADNSICFDEKHAKHVAGADFDTLIVISAE